MPTETAPQHRRLICIPIIHNLADMGALGDSVRKASLRKMGKSGWKRKLDLIEKFWDETEDALERLSVAFPTVRLYQDGLPVSGKETDIVQELAKSGSRNHALLLRLMERGAQLMGTESLELLLKEYELAKRGFQSKESISNTGDELPTENSLLEKRDRFIAQRIDETLLPGEVGIVFLGMLHALERWLPSDVQIEYPVHRPAGGRFPETIR